MKIMLRTILFLITLNLLCLVTYAQTIRYVKEGGAGTKDGLSWANASEDLQATINVSAANDIVVVAKGTYLPTRKATALTTLMPGNRENAFVLKANVKIYGSFEGTEAITTANLETLLPARNLNQNASILSGDFNGDDVITGAGTASLAISNNTENAYHVVISAGNVGNAELNGFRISGGYANAPGASYSVNGSGISHIWGGGLMIIDSSPKISYVEIVNNMVYATGSSDTVFGGGICIYQSSSTIANFIVRDNIAKNPNRRPFGGGCANISYNGTFGFTNGLFENNIAESANDSAFGGGIYSGYTMKITNVVFNKNRAISANYYNGLGGAIFSEMNSLQLNNITAYGNSALYGSFLCDSNYSPSTITTINNSIIWNDNIYIYIQSPVITNSLVQGGFAGTGNLDIDPQFTDATNGNFSLKRTSPAVDAGNNAYLPSSGGAGGGFDFAGLKRLSGTNIDMGAYEYQFAAKALHFDGTDDVVTLPPSTWLDLPELTLEAWFKPERQSGSNQTIFASRSNSATRFSILHSTNGIVLWNGSTASSVNLPQAFGLNRWYHLAVVLKAGTADVYINGQFLGSTINSAGTATNLPFQLGAGVPDGSFETFKGAIDEVRIWSGQRSATEIADNYNRVLGNLANQTNLLAYYEFSEGTANADNTAITTLTNTVSTSIPSANVLNFAKNGTASNWVESYAMVVPTGLSVANAISDRFTLSWQPVYLNDVDNHIVEVATDNLFTQPIAGSPFALGSSATSKIITGLTPATTYYSRIRANKTSLNNQGAYSFVKSISTAAAMPPPGNALNFDGTDDYVQIPNVLSTASAFTIEFWMRTTQTAPGGTQWYNGNGLIDAEVGGAVSDFGISLNGNKLAFGIGSADKTIFSTSAVNTGNWVHVAVVWNSVGGSGKIYINGQLETSTTSMPTAKRSTPTKITFGALNTLINYYKGDLDEVRFWNIARTEEQIQTNMNTVINSSANLLAYYNFNQEGADLGSFLYDITTNGNDATLKNFALSGTTSNYVGSYAMIVPANISSESTGVNSFKVSWDVPIYDTADNYRLEVSTSNTFATQISGSPFLVTALSKEITGLADNTIYYYRLSAAKNSMVGRGVYSLTYQSKTLSPAPGTALKFDGVDDYISLGGSSAFKPTSQLSVGVWVNRADWSVPAYEAIISNTQTGGYSLNIANQATNGSGTFITALVYRNGTYARSLFKADKLTPGWHYIALTYNSRFTIIYVDGNMAAVYDAISTYAITYNAGNSTLIGAEVGTADTPTGSYFSGTLDELRIYNTALTAAEIKADMLSTTSVKTTNLIASYNFDKALPSASTDLTDVSVNMRNGILRNFALSGTESNWVESYAMVMPEALEATNITTNKFTASWNAPLIGTVDNGYVLDVATNVDFTSPIAGSPFAVNALNKEIIGLTAGTTYYYRIRADKTSVTGTGAPSQTISVQTIDPVLPVTLISFTAKAEGNHAKLQWQTTNEFGSRQFAVYKSGDDGKFVKIGEVSSSSSSSNSGDGSQTFTATAYSFTDKTPANGSNYYKLVQIDNDGTATDLGIRTVVFYLQPSILNLFPNPTKDKIKVTFTSSKYHALSLIDNLGRVLKRQSISTKSTGEEIDLSAYPAGVYFVRLQMATGSVAAKVIKR